MSALQPQVGHRFSFGIGGAASAHGDVVVDDHVRVEPCDLVDRLGDLGCWGVALRDDEIGPPGSAPAERDEAVDRLRKALAETGMVVSMMVADLAGHRAFCGGALTAGDRDVRRYAIRKAMQAIDLGAELGARTLGFRTGHTAAVATAAPIDALARYREAIDFLCGYVDDRGYDIRLTLPAIPDIHGDALLPTVGHALALIATLDRPEYVGLAAGGCGTVAGVAQAIDAGRLVHLELNPPAVTGGDTDARFGTRHLPDAFYLVKLLEEHEYDGARHFRIAAHCAADADRLAAFAGGCMRTYLALAAKASRFADDPEVNDALAECGRGGLAEPTVGRFTPAAADSLATERFDLEEVATGDHCGEHLERAVEELLLGLR